MGKVQRIAQHDISGWYLFNAQHNVRVKITRRFRAVQVELGFLGFSHSNTQWLKLDPFHVQFLSLPEMFLIKKAEHF